MELPLLATAYLPSIEYMAILMKRRGAVIEIHETFTKQTYRNRSHIATTSGLLALVVPIIKPNGNHTSTGEIVISYHLPWNRTHWRSIEAAYNSSPFFLYYRDTFEPLFNKQHKSLIEMNSLFLNTILKLLKLDCTITYSTTYLPAIHDQSDLRNVLHPKKQPFFCKLSEFPKYTQVFGEEAGFIPNLSIIDLLFNMGPEARNYLKSTANSLRL
jgi:hypothetical protein